MKRLFLIFSTAVCVCFTALIAVSDASALMIYVAPNGNDAWSGLLPEKNAAQTEGPVATLARAQEIWRNCESPENVTVLLRGGDYFLTEPLVLEEIDRKMALSIEAFPQETPTLHGSQKIQGWKKGADGVLRAVLTPEQAQFVPKQLFSGPSRMIRARFPNFDVQNPYKGGFLYVARGQNTVGAVAEISGSVGQIHNSGDSMLYEITVPNDGKYDLWMLYGADNSSYGIQNLDGRLTMTFDETNVQPLTGAENTGAWTPTRWVRCASAELAAGAHSMKWCNVKGGGINIAAFALSADPNWNPNDPKHQKDLSAKTVVLIPADSFVKAVGKQLSVSYSGSKDAFRFHPGELKPEWAQKGVELKIFQSGSCRAYLEITEIAGIDERNNVVNLAGKECTAMLAKGDRYFLENHSDFLDAPGEWYFDAETRTLSVIPAETDAADSAKKTDKYDFRTDVAGTLIQVVGAGKDGPSANVPLKIFGLEFTETSFTHDDGCVGYSMGSRGVVELKNTAGVTVENCRFLNIGRYAVCMTKGGKNRVERCTIDHSGQGGVLLLDSSENDVSENRITHIGEEYKHIGGVVLESGSEKNVVARNFIQYSSRYGISMKNAGGLNQILENEVRDTSLETFDTGAIEVTQGDQNFQSGTLISGNRIFNTNGYSCVDDLERYMSWGIYLDSFAGGYTVENNYVAHTSHGGFMLQGGKGNIVRGNVFVDGNQCQGYFANYIENSENLVFENNQIVILNPEARLYSAGRNLSKALKCDKNTYWSPAEDVRERSDFKAWQAMGFDQNSRVEEVKY